MAMDKHLAELIAVVDQFIDLESSMEIYYDLCAKIFPEEKFAWFGIATQEGIHAKIFRNMKELIIKDPHKWSLGKYNFEALRTTLDALHAEIDKIRAKNYNSKYVITFARDLEGSLVETDIANAFVSDCSEFRQLVKKIMEETDEHKGFLVKFLASRQDE